MTRRTRRAALLMQSLVLALGMVQPALAQAPAAPAEPPVIHTAADFAALPFVEEPELSPNGEWFAGLFGIDGQRRVCMLSLFETKSKRVCALVPDMMEVHGLEWVNDDNLIIHLTALQLVEGRRWYISRAFGLNRNSGKVKRLLTDINGQNGGHVVWTARDGTPTVEISAQNSVYNGQEFWPAVYRVNVETGAQVKIMNGTEDVMHWVADGTGTVRLGYGYDDERRQSRLLYRRTSHENFHTVDRADKRKREEVMKPVAFLPDGDHGLVIHPDDKGRSALFEVDLTTQADIRAIWTAPEGSWIEGTWVGDDQQTVLGVGLAGQVRDRVWIDPALADLQAAFAKSVPDRRVHIVSFNRNRQRMLVQIDRSDTPGTLYFYDINDGALHRIAWMSDKLKSTPLNPARLVQYKARDGVEIEGVLTLPRGREARHLPVIVMPHGGPWAHDTLDYDYWAQFLASLGYAVIQPNFRGSTGYGEGFERKGEGQLGLAMQDDLNDALKWVGDQGIGDAKRACIVGASYGGYAAMWGLARDPDLWRCGISISGVASLRREVNDMSEGSLTGQSNGDAWKRMTPDFYAVSPINAVAKVKAPLLLVHGKMDVTVDHSQSVSMLARMKSAGKQVELVSVPKADHHFTREADRLVLLQAMERFLQANNPAN